MSAPLRRALLAAGLAVLGIVRPLRAQHPVSIALESGLMEHRVTLGEQLEQTTGVVIGGRVSGRATSWLELHASARGGTLGADRAPAEDRTLGEIALRADAFPLTWLGFVVTTTLRSYSTPLARQRWTVVTVGPEARLALYEQLVHARLRASVVPHVAVSGEPAPDRALTGAVELEYTGARLTAALGYAIERYDFPRVAGARRLEQVGGLAVRLGWKVWR